jgi:HD-like signal output (HDOD) protein
MVNSGFFGLPQPVSDILHAVRMLGFDTLGALVVLGKAFDTFRSAGIDVAAINRLARRSLKIGELARRIGQHDHLSPVEAEQARCAGMLAHVGTLILLANRPAEMLRIQRHLDEAGGNVADWEERAFGTDHAHISAALLSLWGFPDNVVEAVLFHHDPSRCTCNCSGRRSAVMAVHAAQHLVKPVPRGVDAAEFWHRGLDRDYLERGVANNVSAWGAAAATLEER